MAEANPTTPVHKAQEPYYEDEFYKEYISSELSHKRGVFVKKSYLRLVGYDFVTALLLAQIVDWFFKGENAQVYRDGHLWIAKRRTDW